MFVAQEVLMAFTAMIRCGTLRFKARPEVTICMKQHQGDSTIVYADKYAFYMVIC